MITNEVEKAKQALTNVYTLEKAEFELMWRWDDDPKYPYSFWRVSYYQDKRNAEKKEENWNCLTTCDLDKLEEAIAYPIVKTSSNIHYQQTEVPERLQKYWKSYKIIVEDRIRFKKGDVRVGTLIHFWVQLTTGEWKLDYEDRRNGFASALTFVPGHYYWMHEGGVPWELSYINNEEPKNNDIVGFIYKGHYFDKTYYFPEQKCICGESKTYYNDYDEGGSIKVEVWSVDKFFKKDVVYKIDRGRIFYNGEFYRDPYIEETTFLSSQEEERIRKLFPKAKEIETEMSWVNIV